MDLIWKIGARAKEILQLKEEDKKPNEKVIDEEPSETQCPASNVEDQKLQVPNEDTVQEASTQFDKSFTPDEKEPANSKETTEQLETTYFLPVKLSTDNMKEVSLKAAEQARSFGNFLYGVANMTTSSLSETAKYLKNTVEQNSLLEDFNKQHEVFVSSQTSKPGDTGVPPWVGYEDEENIKQQILSLSFDKRNFLRSPPSGISFEFSFDSMYPVAAVMLKEDPSLEKMRFNVVPKFVSEENFWRNYFYRVSLLKQSTRLSSMSHQKNAGGDPVSWTSKKDTSEENAKESRLPTTKEPEETDDNSNHEFVSDDFQGSHISKEDIKQGMKLLGVVEQGTKEDDWEEELQQELQEYEVVAGENVEVDPVWEKEVDQILESEKLDQDQKSVDLIASKEFLQTGVFDVDN